MCCCKSSTGAYIRLHAISRTCPYQTAWGLECIELLYMHVFIWLVFYTCWWMFQSYYKKAALRWVEIGQCLEGSHDHPQVAGRPSHVASLNWTWTQTQTPWVRDSWVNAPGHRGPCSAEVYNLWMFYPKLLYHLLHTSEPGKVLMLGECWNPAEGVCVCVWTTTAGAQVIMFSDLLFLIVYLIGFVCRTTKYFAKTKRRAKV